jgi:hypothetical protein
LRTLYDIHDCDFEGVGDAPSTFVMAWQSLMVSRMGGKLFSSVKKCQSRDEFGDVWIARASSGMEFYDGGFIS